MRFRGRPLLFLGSAPTESTCKATYPPPCQPDAVLSRGHRYTPGKECSLLHTRQRNFFCAVWLYVSFLHEQQKSIWRSTGIHRYVSRCMGIYLYRPILFSGVPVISARFFGGWRRMLWCAIVVARQTEGEKNRKSGVKGRFAKGEKVGWQDGRCMYTAG